MYSPPPPPPAQYHLHHYTATLHHATLNYTRLFILHITLLRLLKVIKIHTKGSIQLALKVRQIRHPLHIARLRHLSHSLRSTLVDNNRPVCAGLGRVHHDIRVDTALRDLADLVLALEEDTAAEGPFTDPLLPAAGTDACCKGCGSACVRREESGGKRERERELTEKAVVVDAGAVAGAIYDGVVPAAVFTNLTNSTTVCLKNVSNGSYRYGRYKGHITYVPVGRVQRMERALKGKLQQAFDGMLWQTK